MAVCKSSVMNPRPSRGDLHDNLIWLDPDGQPSIILCDPNGAINDYIHVIVKGDLIHVVERQERPDV